MQPPPIFTDIWAEHLMLIDLWKMKRILRGRREGWLLLISVGMEMWKSAKWLAQLYSLFVMPERTEDLRASICYLSCSTRSLSHFLCDPPCRRVPDLLSGSLYISQLSSVRSHSLMMNRAAALALALTATCRLVTLNDSHMQRFTHMRGRRARQLWWSPLN